MAARKGKAKTAKSRVPASDRRARFVEEYLVDLCATQAAIRAGYSAKTARQQGARLLSEVAVADAIAKAQAERSERVKLDQSYVVEVLQELVEKCTGRKPVTVTVKGEKVERLVFDSAGAAKAAGLLGKHLGMFVERIGDPDGKPLQAPNVTVSFVKPRGD